MTQARTSSTSSKTPAEERLVDEMVEETFPASDATQLPGRADDGEPAAAPARAGNAERPRTIGNQGVPPSSRMIEETFPLADQGVVTLRFDGEHRRLHVFLGEDGLSLDAAAVDRLIAVLSEKRVQMQ